MSYSREQLESWLKTLTNIKGNVLDVGGSQLPIIKRLNKNELYIDEYKILDLETPHECKQEPDIIFDLNYPIKLKEVANVNFNIAFCIEVSEYWWNPIQALNNINELLGKDGILYLSTHFIYPVHNPTEQDYIRYTPKGIEKMLEETGFKILEMKPRLFKDNFNLRIDNMRPAKNYDKHQWQGALIRCQKIQN